MYPSLIEIGSKTAEKNCAQTGRHYENNGHLAVNQHNLLGGDNDDNVVFVQTLEVVRNIKVAAWFDSDNWVLGWCLTCKNSPTTTLRHFFETWRATDDPGNGYMLIEIDGCCSKL